MAKASKSVMSLISRFAWPPLLSACAMLVAPAACTDDTPGPSTCTSALHPTFHVTLTAVDGAVPPDTVLRVTYGGSAMESYDLADGHDGPSLFCARVIDDAGLVTPWDADAADADNDAALVADADAGPDAGSGANPDAAASPPGPVIASLGCDLWTSGAATVEVTASGYAPLFEDLALPKDSCEVSEVALELERPDAP